MKTDYMRRRPDPLFVMTLMFCFCLWASEWVVPKLKKPETVTVADAKEMFVSTKSDKQLGL